MAGGWQYTPYSLPLFAAALISAVLAVYAWRRRHVPGATGLSLMLTAEFVWALFYALELSAVDLGEKIFYTKLEYLGISTLSVAWLAFALQYTGRERWLTSRNLASLLAIPLVTVVLAATNEWHGLIWSYTGLDTSKPFAILVIEHGAWFWVIWVYSYLLILLGSVLLVTRLWSTLPIYRLQGSVLLAAVVVPWVGNAVYVVGLSPVEGLELTPLAFAVSGLAYTLGLLKFRLLDIAPVARDAVIEGMGDGVIVVDLGGRVVDYNPAARRILNLPASRAVGLGVERLLPIRASQEDGPRREATFDVMDERRTYSLSLSHLHNNKGRAIGRLILLQDITEQKRAAEALRQSEQRYRAVVENAGEGIFLLDTPTGRIIESNTALQNLLGYAASDLASMTIYDVVAHDPQDISENIRLVTENRKHHLGERKYRRSDDSCVDVEVSSSAVSYGDREVLCAVVRDITHRKTRKEKLRQQALHDPLTGLPNRHLFMERLKSALSEGEHGLALLFLDLDEFKKVNDTLGHEEGDRLLVSSARRIEGCLRDSDTASRLGGDEFTVLLKNLPDPEEAAWIGERIISRLREPFLLSRTEVWAGTSMGIVSNPHPEESPESLMRRADLAMYAAKKAGRNRFEIYDTEMEKEFQPGEAR